MATESLEVASVEEGSRPSNGHSTHHHDNQLSERQVQEENDYWEKMDGKRKESETDLLVGMYCMVLVTTGCVMNMTTALTARTPQESIFHIAYHIILYTIAFGFFLYIFVAIIWPYEIKIKRDKEKRMKKEEARMSNGDGRSGDTIGNGGVTKTAQTSVEEETESEEILPVDRENQGVHLYLRIGLILFGVSAMIMDLFKLAIIFEFPLKCLAVLFVPVSVLRPIFLFVQTCFLVKSHTLVVNVNKAWMKFGVGHLIATNMCIWIWLVVEDSTSYAYQHIRQVAAQQAAMAAAAAEAGNHGNLSDDGHGDDSHDVHKRAADDHHDDHDVMGLFTTAAHDVYEAYNSTLLGVGHGDGHADGHGTMAPLPAGGPPPNPCILRDSLAWRASSFLNPSFVAFSLVAIAILFRIYKNIGTRCDHTEIEFVEDKEGKKNPCHRANTGLFFGCAIVLWVVMATALYRKVEGSYVKDSMSPALYFFYITVDIITIASFLAIIVSARAMATMGYINLTSKDVGVNGNLSFITLLGLVTYDIFKIICCVKYLVMVEYKNFVAMALVGALISSVQAVSQTIFIMDALYRRARNLSHVREKPGRNAITFLLACNLALWIVALFETKKYDTADFFKEYYSHVAWIIVTFLFVPLVILFRFVATVCLSQIWTSAYDLKKKTN